MSAALTEALRREEDRARSDGAADIDAITAHALGRIRRRRTHRRVAAAGALVALIGGSAWALASTTTPATLAAPSPSASVPDPLDLAGLGAGDLSAGALIASSAPRLRGEAPETPRQAALLCQLDPAINPWRDAPAGESTLTETRPCEAVWVGAAPLITADTVRASLHVRVDERGAEVVVEWLAWAPEGTALTVDDAAAAVTLATAPDQPGTEGLRTRRAYVGDSGWVTDTQRITVLGNVSQPVTLGQGAAMVSGSVRLTTQGPGSALHATELWSIATGEAVPEITLQLRVVPEGGTGDQELILEVPAEPTVDVAGLTAEDLLVGAKPRERADRTTWDRQAASVCELPEELSVPFRAGDLLWEPAWGAVLCDPGWLGKPLFEPTYAPGRRENVGIGGLVVEWTLHSIAGDAVLVAGSTLLVEPHPRRSADVSELSVKESAAYTVSAWTDDGKRALPVNNMSTAPFARHTQDGTYTTYAASLASSAYFAGPAVDTETVAKAIRGGARLTGLVAVPFADDPTRVLLLEVPLGDEVGVSSIAYWGSQ